MRYRHAPALTPERVSQTIDETVKRLKLFLWSNTMNYKNRLRWWANRGRFFPFFLVQ
jgi:hypothetical protein